jgi:hypothetical protein
MDPIDQFFDNDEFGDRTISGITFGAIDNSSAILETYEDTSPPAQIPSEASGTQDR